MFKIYAMHFNQNGSIRESKTLIQSVPASSENEIYLINPKVSTKVGSAESFEFSLQPGTKYYDSFIQFRTFFYVEYDGDLLFYGRVLTIENSFWGERQVKCEGAFAFFNDSYFPSEEESKREVRSTAAYITAVLENHNNQLQDPLRYVYPGEIPGMYTSATASEQRVEEDSRAFGENGWRQTKAALDDLTSHYGGMFRIRYGIDNRLYLDWYKHYYNATISNQIIEVSKNLIDINRITEVNNIFTVVVPIGKGASDDTKVYIDGMYFPVSRVSEFYTPQELRSGYHLPEDYAQAESKYGVIIKPQEFNECSTPEVLLIECAKWVKENYQGGVEEFSVSAVDFHQHGVNVRKILAGDRNRIRYPIGNGKTEERVLTCTSASFELYNPENNQYTFGIPASSLKGYNVNSKKSDKDADEIIKDLPTPGGNPAKIPNPYEEWYDDALSWLKSHRVWWTHLTEAEKLKHSRGLGPNGDTITSNFIYDIAAKDDDGDALTEVWVPYFERTHNVGTAKEPKYVYDWRIVGGRPTGRWKRIKRKTLKDYSYDLKSDHLFEYVYNEWNKKNFSSDLPLFNPSNPNEIFSMLKESGFEFDTGTIEKYLNVGDTIMSAFSPKNLLGLGEGSWGDFIVNKLDEWGLGDNPIVIKGKEFINNLGETVTNIFSFGDGNYSLGALKEDLAGKFDFTQILVDAANSYLNVSGDIHCNGDITWFNDMGDLASAKQLEIETVNTKTEFGSLVNDYFTNPITGEREIYAYKFSQAIEEYANGQLVVATVDGNVVKLGGNHTATVITTALNNISNVCGEFTYSVDPNTGERKVVLHDGTGMYMTKNNTEYGVFHDGNLTAGVLVEKFDEISEEERVEARASLGFYDSGTLTSGVIVERFRNIDENDRIVARTGLGFFDDGTLTGGVMVDKLNDNSVTTHIIGDRILVGDKSGSYYAGYLVSGHFYRTKTSDGTYADEISGQANKYYGDITSDNVYIWENGAFTLTSKTLDLQASNMKGLIGTKATVVELNAVSAKVGRLETDLVNADKIKARIGSIDLVGVNSLQFLDGSSPTGGVRYTNLRSLLHAVRVVANGTNGYKLQYQSGYAGWGDDATWVDAGTFNRAVSLSGAWNSGVYTVSATVGTISGAAPNTNLKGGLSLGTPTKGTGNTIDVTYDIGYGEIVSGQWRRAGSTGQTGTMNLDVSSLLETRTVTSNGTYTPSTGKIGISSIKVNVSDIANAKSRFGSGSGGYYIEAYDNRNGNSIANSSVSYKLGTSGSTSSTVVQVQNSSGTKIGAEISVGSLYTSGWNTALTNAANNGTWSSGIYKYDGKSLTTTLKLESNGSVSKTGDYNVKQNFILKYYDSSLAPTTTNPYSSTGYSLDITLNAKSVYDSAYDSGFVDGWHAFYDDSHWNYTDYKSGNDYQVWTPNRIISKQSGKWVSSWADSAWFTYQVPNEVYSHSTSIVYGGMTTTTLPDGRNVYRFSYYKDMNSASNPLGSMSVGGSKTIRWA